MTGAQESRRITVRLSDALAQRLSDIAAQQGTDVSALVRTALQAYLNPCQERSSAIPAYDTLDN